MGLDLEITQALPVPDHADAVCSLVGGLSCGAPLAGTQAAQVAFTRHLGHQGVTVFLAWLPMVKEWVGTATLVEIPKMTHNQHPAGQLEDLFVHEDYRGMGIGAALVRTVISTAINHSCYKLTLTCERDLVNWYCKLAPFVRWQGVLRLDF